MAYHIDYFSSDKDNPPDEKYCSILMVISFFAIFCWIVSAYWPSGYDYLQMLLIPGDPETTLEAAEAFATELGNGKKLTEAVHHFCNVILSHGQ